MIKVDDLHLTYRTQMKPLHILKGISFHVPSGDMVAIRGPSGSGKSTLFYVLGCLLKPDSGKVWIQGQDITVLSKEECARLRNLTLGFVFQQFHLLPRTTVLENILLPVHYQCDFSGKNKF